MRIFGLILSVALGIFVISGCSQTNNIENANEAISEALAGAPDWVLSEGGDSILSASGSAKIKNNNIGFAVTQAEAQARNKIAGQISTQVESKYRELTTSGEDSVSQEAVLAIRQSVNQVLAGSKTTDKWISKTGDMWVLMQVNQSNLDLLKKYLSNAQGIDKEAAKTLAKSVDELIDGFSND